MNKVSDLRGKFAMIHADAFAMWSQKYTDPETGKEKPVLTPASLAVYIALIMRASHDEHSCFPSLQTIADDAGVNRDTANNAVQRLKEVGLIGIKNRRSDTGQTSNEYTVLAGPFTEFSASRVGNPDSPQSEIPTHPSRKSRHELDTVNKTQVNENSSVSDSDESSPVAPSESEAPTEKPKRKSNLSPEEEAIFEVYCQENNVEKAANFGRLRKETKAIISEAGSNADEIRNCMRWMRRDQFWQGKVIQIISVHNKLDEFRATARPAETNVPRPNRYDPAEIDRRMKEQQQEQWNRMLAMSQERQRQDAGV